MGSSDLSPCRDSIAIDDKLSLLPNGELDYNIQNMYFTHKCLYSELKLTIFNLTCKKM